MPLKAPERSSTVGAHDGVSWSFSAGACNSFVVMPVSPEPVRQVQKGRVSTKARPWTVHDESRVDRDLVVVHSWFSLPCRGRSGTRGGCPLAGPAHRL